MKCRYPVAYVLALLPAAAMCSMFTQYHSAADTSLAMRVVIGGSCRDLYATKRLYSDAQFMFREVPALDGSGGVSLTPSANPGYYICDDADRSGRLVALISPPSAALCSFKKVAGLSNPSLVSFEQGGRYIGYAKAYDYDCAVWFDGKPGWTVGLVSRPAFPSLATWVTSDSGPVQIYLQHTSSSLGSCHGAVAFLNSYGDTTAWDAVPALDASAKSAAAFSLRLVANSSLFLAAPQSRNGTSAPATLSDCRARPSDCTWAVDVPQSETSGVLSLRVAGGNWTLDVQANSTTPQCPGATAGAAVVRLGQGATLGLWRVAYDIPNTPEVVAPADNSSSEEAAAPGSCANYKLCRTCATAPLPCGWCADTGVCSEGTAARPSNCSASQWLFNTCVAPAPPRGSHGSGKASLVAPLVGGIVGGLAVLSAVVVAAALVTRGVRGRAPAVVNLPVELEAPGVFTALDFASLGTTAPMPGSVSAANGTRSSGSDVMAVPPGVATVFVTTLSYAATSAQTVSAEMVQPVSLFSDDTLTQQRVYVHDDGTPSYFDRSGQPAEPLRTRRQAEQQAANSPATMPDSWDAEANAKRARFAQDLSASVSRRAKTRATEPLVVVLVQYPDYATRAGTKEHILRKVFNASSTEGDTVNSYYAIQSDGKFQFSVAPETSGDANDGVIGPVTVNCAWLNRSKTGRNTDYDCVQRGALLAAAEFLDLESFDLNADGLIDGSELHVVLVVAGGENSGLTAAGIARCPNVWAFMQLGAGLRVEAQGVAFGEHVVIGENVGDCTEPFHIGTISHELGHTLGLLDVYDQDSGNSFVGYYCLMDIGCWNNNGNNPGMISPFLRSYLGWLTPTVVSAADTASFTLKPAALDRNAVLQFGANPNGVDWEWGTAKAHSGIGEYFLVENRQQVGCDKYTPGSGVIVWHINEAAAPESTRVSAASVIMKLLRRNQTTPLEIKSANDVLSNGASQSMYCGANDSTVMPNTLLDNESASCVSFSASVNTRTLEASVKPWTDTGCGSCVWGQGGIAPPTREYSFIEKFGLSLVPMDSTAANVTFRNGFGTVELPFAFNFGGADYTKAFIGAAGFINFVSINLAINGGGKNPTIAPYSGGAAATSALVRSFACTAQFGAAGQQCYAVQWNTAALTFQAVLTQSGDIYFLYSGSVTKGPVTFVSTGPAGAVVYAGTVWIYYDWSTPSASPAALLVAPRRLGLLGLPWSDSLETVEPASWSNVLCARPSDVCGSASGNALTFDPDHCHNNLAVPVGFNVSGCTNVSISFVFGPSQASAPAGCSSVAQTVFWGLAWNALGYPSSDWLMAAVGDNTATVAPNGAQSMYIIWDWVSKGRFYIDDVRVQCVAPTPQAPVAESSSALSNETSAVSLTPVASSKARSSTSETLSHGSATSGEQAKSGTETSSSFSSSAAALSASVAVLAASLLAL
eukprot:m51a1_g6554 hypothetical protein (1436) ;mRNA; r:97541-103439